MGLSISDLYRAWLLKNLGVAQGGSEKDLETALFSGESLVPGLDAISQYKSGWYIAPSGAASTGIPNEGDLCLLPVVIPKSGLVADRIVCEVTSAGTAGALVRMGIYKQGTNGIPGSLLLDAGTIDGTIVQRASININQPLPAGVIWLASAMQGGAGTRPTMRTQGGVGQFIRQVDDAVSFTFAGFRQLAVAGALPANFTLDNTSGVVPRMSLRFV